MSTVANYSIRVWTTSSSYVDVDVSSYLNTSGELNSFLQKINSSIDPSTVICLDFGAAITGNSVGGFWIEYTSLKCLIIRHALVWTNSTNHWIFDNQKTSEDFSKSGGFDYYADQSVTYDNNFYQANSYTSFTDYATYGGTISNVPSPYDGSGGGSDSGGGDDSGDTETLESITVSSSNGTTAIIGGSALSLSVTANYSNGTSVSVSNSDVTWSSSDTSVATVSSGSVTGNAEGTATITASYSGKTASMTVTVKESSSSIIKVDSVTISGPNSVEPKKTITLTATTSPSGASTPGVYWYSKNSNIAKVDSNTGVVTGVAPGTVTITATARDGYGASATYNVTVSEVSVTGISVSPSSVSNAYIGYSFTLGYTLSPYNATTGTDVTFVSSDTSVATVSSSGVVKILKYSSSGVNITASANGYSASCSVSITADTSRNGSKLWRCEGIKDGKTGLITWKKPTMLFEGYESTMYIAKGEWSKDEFYTGNDIEIDVVYVTSGTGTSATRKYYKATSTAGENFSGEDTGPGNVSYWTEIQSYPALASALMYAENAVIENATITKLRTSGVQGDDKIIAEGNELYSQDGTGVRRVTVTGDNLSDTGEMSSQSTAFEKIDYTSNVLGTFYFKNSQGYSNEDVYELFSGNVDCVNSGLTIPQMSFPVSVDFSGTLEGEYWLILTFELYVSGKTSSGTDYTSSVLQTKSITLKGTSDTSDTVSLPQSTLNLQYDGDYSVLLKVGCKGNRTDTDTLDTRIEIEVKESISSDCVYSSSQGGVQLASNGLQVRYNNNHYFRVIKDEGGNLTQSLISGDCGIKINSEDILAKVAGTFVSLIALKYVGHVTVTSSSVSVTPVYNPYGTTITASRSDATVTLSYSQSAFNGCSAFAIPISGTARIVCVSGIPSASSAKFYITDATGTASYSSFYFAFIG